MLNLMRLLRSRMARPFREQQMAGIIPLGNAMATNEIRPLTGLRGIASVLVLLYHVVLYDAYYTGPVPTLLRRSGYLGVDVFFVLSGFVMSLSYGRSFSGGITPSNYGMFMSRRMARIYPLYFVITTIAFLHALLFHHAASLFSFCNYIANAAMVQTWGLGFVSISADTWSLSTEFFVYIFFPALVLLVFSVRPVYAWVVLLASAALLVRVGASGLGVRGQLDVVSAASVFPVMRCVAGFCLGMLCYKIAQLPAMRKPASSRLILPVLLVVFLCVLVWSHCDLLAYCFFPLIVLALYFESPGAKALFANKLIYHLGVISYSIYLVHPWCIAAAQRLGQTMGQRRCAAAHLVTLSLSCLLTWICAFLLYRFVEVPGRVLVQKTLLRSSNHAATG